MLAAQLSRTYWFKGDLEPAAARAELALDISEKQRLAGPLAVALRAKGLVTFSLGHLEESLALMKHALDFSLEHDLEADTAVSYFILSDRCFRSDRYTEALEYLDKSLALARKQGDRPREWGALSERTYPLLMLGRWDEVVETADTFTQEQVDSGGVVLSLLQAGVEVHVQRGELDAARCIFSLYARLETSTDVQDRETYFASAAALRRAEGRLEEALTVGIATLESAKTLGYNSQGVKGGLVDAIEAALALGNHARAEELLAIVDGLPTGRSLYLDAHARRLRARLSPDGSGYAQATGLFRELGIPFWLAVTQLEHAERLIEQGRADEVEPLLAEAREIFEQLGARPWLQRLDALAPLSSEVPA